MNRTLFVTPALGLSSFLAILILAEPAASGEDVTCGWCSEFTDSEGNSWHGFYDEEGDECGWPAPEDPDGGGEEFDVECSRCGGDSSCHTSFGEGEGECHLKCGPGGGLAALDAVEQGLRIGEPRLLARAMELDRGEADAVTVWYDYETGHIAVDTGCDRVGTTVFVFPIPREIEVQLVGLSAD